MNDIQALQYEMLVKLDEVCHKHGLRYYLAFGTCLGALRHKGFIPWDDDMDIFMFREDFVNLSNIFEAELGNNFYLLFPGSKKYKGECLSADTMFPLKAFQFEDTEKYVFNDYDKYLRNLYGDYMMIPKVENREQHLCLKSSVTEETRIYNAEGSTLSKFLWCDLIFDSSEAAA